MKVSNSDKITEIVSELQDRQFTVSKASTHFKLYSPYGKFVCPIPTTGSDWRGELNFLGQIRRFLLAHKMRPLERDIGRKRFEEQLPDVHIPSTIELGPKWGGEPSKYDIRNVKDNPEIQQKEKPKMEHRFLTHPEDFNFIQKMSREGKKYDEIIEILTAMGYVGRLSKKKMSVPTLSQWMIKHGFIAKFKNTSQALPKVPEPTPAAVPPISVPAEEPKHWVPVDEAIHKPVVAMAPATVPAQQPHVMPTDPIKHKLLTEVLDIVSSNMSDDSKEKVLRLMAREFAANG